MAPTAALAACKSNLPQFFWPPNVTSPQLAYARAESLRARRGQCCRAAAHMRLDMFPLTTSTFLDDLPMPIIIYALDGMTVLINSAAETFWGLKRAEHVGISNVFDDATAAVV